MRDKIGKDKHSDEVGPGRAIASSVLVSDPDPIEVAEEYKCKGRANRLRAAQMLLLAVG
jgi:hypothetical protein